MHERCVPNCKPRDQSCKKEEKGFFAEVRYLQLHGESSDKEKSILFLFFLLCF